MVDKLAIAKRLQADGRWVEVEPVKNRMIKEARQQGMDKESAKAWSYAEIDRLYPPLPPPEPATAVSSAGGVGTGPIGPIVPAGEPEAASGHLTLGEIPADWPVLPANASLPVEIGWVQSNRIDVVEELSTGSTRVHLDRAHEPAPSRAALGWLETSIRSYAKYVDVVARSLAVVQDEQEHVRRERMALEEIDELLREMREE